MIKDKLMKALKTAAADYNNGMGANMAVACAAEAWDFNEKQAERLVEMFNTAAAINQEKSASDPSGTCELADKDEVAKILVGKCSDIKKASAHDEFHDYSFYSEEPSRTNPSIESRASGMAKAASFENDAVPEGLDLSQGSLFKIINEKIDLLKSAAEAAGDVANGLEIEIDSDVVKIAKAIEFPDVGQDVADMFKAACQDKDVVERVSSYSTKVAESTGGKYAGLMVFDPAPVDELLKVAENIGKNSKLVSEFKAKKAFYEKQAEEAEMCLKDAVGLSCDGEEKKDHGIADMFRGIPKKASPRESSEDGVCASKRISEIAEKVAAVNMGFAVPVPTLREAHGALVSGSSVDHEQQRILNARRAVILSDLMANDPIIRDADPETVGEAYKTMIMTSPRVSLDRSQVRAFLRSAVNSVAISPSDAKVIADVDKGISFANVGLLDRLTTLDSSIKDSNI